ncbi:hypothetical protein Droror1_Dr00018325 [Drosera rotundifolia]
MLSPPIIAALSRIRSPTMAIGKNNAAVEEKASAILPISCGLGIQHLLRASRYSLSRTFGCVFALVEDRLKESLRLRMYLPRWSVNMPMLVSEEGTVVHISKDVILRVDDMNTSSTDSPWNIGASLMGYIESNHNVSQLQAIRAALSRKPIVPIQGPPGTGKTQTILGLLSGVLHATPVRRHDRDQSRSYRFCNFALTSPWMTGNNIRDMSMPVNGDDGFYPVTGNELKPDIVIGSCKYRARVLVCAPSNSALDEIVLRALHQESEMRMGVPTLRKLCA